ncbi:hypothetical protein JOF53_000139 [Crossiella equi]|uniref:Imm-5-like domain-containing protein n=1 Tax=Crossiella equi TaxID=130796 RepID=A0ABS5A4Q2_9PSEU|nr:exonuclease SbcC [Crossiella equi]MBP2471267.1 hypothetical protein [Crossiella equi]
MYFDLSLDELRRITTFALACAEPALPVFSRDRPEDPRVREALAAARAFAGGGRRTKAIRVTALAAHRAARAAGSEAAAHAARAAGAAGSSAYLHPLAKATQVLHILGSAAHAARAFELTTGDAGLARVLALADPTVRAVLARYPAAPGGRGRVGELVRVLDTALRQSSSSIVSAAAAAPPAACERLR